MKNDRLFHLVYLLMERKRTIGELAEELEVSTRTIARDLDSLGRGGVPIATTRGKGGGVGILPGFVLDRSCLSEEEQNEILFALQSLTLSGGLERKETQARLSRLFQKQPGDWIGMDFSHWGGGPAEREKFTLLKKGILQRQVCTFVYFNSRGEVGQREVEPGKLWFKSGAWYLQGFCRQKKETRTFKVDRMEQLALKEEHFLREEPAPKAPSLDAVPGKTVQLTLRFHKELGFRVLEEFLPRQIERHDDGSFTVQAEYPQGEWISSYLLSFGEEMEVLSPQWLRRILGERAEKIAKMYGEKEK